MDTTSHQSPAAPDLSEVWCRHCDQPATRNVNGEAYCPRHAIDQDFRLYATSWNPSSDRSPWVRRAMAGQLPAKELTR